MFVSTIFLCVLALAVYTAANPLASSNTNSCSDGPVSLHGRRCTRACGYEFSASGVSYRNEYKACYSECSDACAADARCVTAKWNYASKKCYYSDRSCDWQKTGRGDGIKCQKAKTKLKTTTTWTTLQTSSSTTSSSTTSSSTTSSTTNTATTTTPQATTPTTTTTSAAPTCTLSPGDPCQAHRTCPGCDNLVCTSEFGSNVSICQTCLPIGASCDDNTLCCDGSSCASNGGTSLCTPS